MDHNRQNELRRLVPQEEMTLPEERRDEHPGIYTPRPEQKVTVGKTVAMRDDWYDSVLLHLGREGGDRNESKKLMRALRKEKQDTRPTSNLGKNIIDEGELEQVYPLDLPRQLVSRVSHALGKPLEETGVEVRDTFIRHLNNDKEWKTIEHEMVEPGGQSLTSRMTPVNSEFQETFDRFGTTGLGSMSGRLTPEKRTGEEKTRPINLWETSLEKDDKTLFKGLRSGAFVDTSTDPDEKKNNSSSRAKGVLQTALIERLSKMNDEDRKRYLGGGDTFNGTMVSIDLLSGTGSDKSMALQHHETLRGMSGLLQDLDVDWEGESYKVPAKWDIIDFMTGVNGVNTKTGPVPMSFSPDWSKKQDQFNQVSWDKLQQQVKVFETTRGGTEDPETLDQLSKIKALSQGIEETGLGSSGSYQLPAMIANLGFQLGDSVHFNCKSGKDRTGIMDSETKFMARQLDKQSGNEEMIVPNVSNPKGRSETQNYEHEQMMWESGSLDVLAQNVGGQCLKTADIAKLPLVGKTDKLLSNNLGGSEKLKELGGLKRYGDIDTISTFEKKDFMGGLHPLSKKEKREYRTEGQEYVDSLPDVKPLPELPRPRPGTKPQPPIPLQGYVEELMTRPGLDGEESRERPKGVPKGAFKLF